MRVRPVTPMRDFHSIHNSDSPRMNGDRWTMAVHRGDAALEFGGQGTEDEDIPCVIAPEWWRQFAYPHDRSRGQEWSEDCWSPGYFEQGENSPFWSFDIRFLLSSRGRDFESANEKDFQFHRSGDHKVNDLTRSGLNFVVQRQFSKRDWATSIIAGYPWFGDWGRDTMISIPGLMLCTGRLDEARSCLLTFARHLRHGLIPNLFDDYGQAAHYNSVDASLWFIHAVHELWKTTKTPPPFEGGGGGVGGAHKSRPIVASKKISLSTVDNRPTGREEIDAELFGACRQIVAAYRAGTDFNIRMDQDGLIAAGDESTQLTWMDAKRDGVVFTPRFGKPVEINALWFNTLRCLAEMSDDPAERDDLILLSERVATSFREQFWWEERACLHDVLTPRDEASRNRESGEFPRESFIPDGKLRPNQIFAVSLPFSPLHEDQQRAVVKIVGARLLTPFGLRTLDRDDPHYQRRYEGSLFQRDAAYHQGTVWPWLIGPYCEALLRIEQFSNSAKAKVREIIQPLIAEMNNGEGGRCLGQIAEVYDGDPPQRPSGCPAQAWSVAEVLRIVTMVQSD